MKLLSKDLTRCMGDSCTDKNRCKRYLTQAIDDPDGMYSYISNMRLDTPNGFDGIDYCNHFIKVTA